MCPEKHYASDVEVNLPPFIGSTRAWRRSSHLRQPVRGQRLGRRVAVAVVTGLHTSAGAEYGGWELVGR